MMKNKAYGLILIVVLVISLSSASRAQDSANQTTAEQLQELEKKGFQSDPKVLQNIAKGGQPLGRWKEGLMFDGIAPMPWLKSASNWFPGTEEVQPSEIRVTFMGSSPLPRPGQMGTSVYVELGNGDRFIFDMGPGAIANYLAARIPMNQINDILISHLPLYHFTSVIFLLY